MLQLNAIRKKYDHKQIMFSSSISEGSIRNNLFYDAITYSKLVDNVLPL